MAERPRPLKPIDGEFVHGDTARAEACRKTGHSPEYLNLSVSTKVGYKVMRCHCGEVDEAPAALAEWKRLRKKARQ